MDSALAQIRALVNQADEQQKIRILASLRDLQNSIGSPKDVLFDIYNSHLKLAVVYVGVELGLFEELVRVKTGVLTVSELAEKTNASPDLLVRLLRYLSSVGFLANPGVDQFQANKTTYALADPMGAACIIHAFDTNGPAIAATPSFLAENKYQDITSNTKTPFQKGFNTELTCFQWLTQQPKLFNALQKVMTGLQSSDWIEGFDLIHNEARFLQLAQPQLQESVFLVDVGGGHGHQCIQLLRKFPNLRDRLVLQDVKAAVDNLPPVDGVTVMEQDFFEKQAVKGARFYYLRRILHDWPDKLSIQILRNLAAAFSAGSRILIDEVVLPDIDGK